MSLAEYSWLSVSPSPPGRWDLRLMGWTLHSFFRCEDLPRGIPALLDWRVGCRCPDWGLLQNKQNVIVIGVDDAETRSQLLSEGFGDALDSQHALVELAARLLKLEGLAKSIPQQRRAGPLVLDLFRRDARLKDRCIGLHPREFGLLWRLAEIPHRQVSRKELLQDVCVCGTSRRPIRWRSTSPACAPSWRSRISAGWSRRIPMSVTSLARADTVMPRRSASLQGPRWTLAAR